MVLIKNNSHPVFNISPSTFLSFSHYVPGTVFSQMLSLFGIVWYVWTFKFTMVSPLESYPNTSPRPQGSRKGYFGYLQVPVLIRES